MTELRDPASPARTTLVPEGRRDGPGVGQHVSAELLASLPSRLALAAGAWLLIAPFALAYSTTGAGFRAYWDDVLVGTVVITVAALQIALPKRIPALAPLATALGGWLAAAPFLLGFSSSGGAPRAAVNDVLVGVLLVVLGVLGGVLGRRVALSSTEAPRPGDADSIAR